jgi:nicotinamidase-related amidase
MPSIPSIDRTRAALLVMDYQVDIVARARADALLPRATSLLAAARAASLPVIHVVVGFRPGYPEVSPRNLAFSDAKKTGRLSAGSPGVEIHGAIAPRPDEPIVMKHRVGAFTGTDLELILRARDVDTLILAGISTSGVVLSTVRHAADGDYRLVVVEDCCADPDPEVHRCLVERVFPKQATVARSEDVIRALAS